MFMRNFQFTLVILSIARWVRKATAPFHLLIYIALTLSLTSSRASERKKPRDDIDTSTSRERRVAPTIAEFHSFFHIFIVFCRVSL